MLLTSPSSEPTFPSNGRPAFHIHRWRVVFLAGMGCALGIAWEIIRSRDAALGLLRRLGLTNRTSRESLWNDVLASLGGAAQIGLSDERNLIGWSGRYSDSGAERSLFLERAAWVNQDGSLTPISGEGIFLTDKAEIEYMMFLDTPETSPNQMNEN